MNNKDKFRITLMVVPTFVLAVMGIPEDTPTIVAILLGAMFGTGLYRLWFGGK